MFELKKKQWPFKYLIPSNFEKVAKSQFSLLAVVIYDKKKLVFFNISFLKLNSLSKHISQVWYPTRLVLERNIFDQISQMKYCKTGTRPRTYIGGKILLQ